MPITKRGIYHNLKESKYTVSNDEIVFFFSSDKYRKKYMDGYKENRETFVNKLDRFTEKLPLNMEILADIEFYKKCEKRGFRVWLKGFDISYKDLYQYALREMMNSNSKDWFEKNQKLGVRYGK